MLETCIEVNLGDLRFDQAYSDAMADMLWPWGPCITCRWVTIIVIRCYSAITCSGLVACFFLGLYDRSI